MRVLVDFSNLARVCWYPAKVAAEENPSLSAQSILLRNWDLKLGTVEEAIGVQRSKYVFVRDSRAQWKYDLFPEYKANRPPQDYDPRPDSETYLRGLGHQFAIAHGQEADDAIAALASQGDEPVTIVSSDRDLWQLLDPPRVSNWSPSLGRYVQVEDVVAAFRVGPHHLRLAKSLWGDSGDNIPNVMPRMQKKLVPLIQQTDGTLEALIQKVDGWADEKTKSLMHANLAKIALNYVLVGLNKEVPVAAE